MFSSYNQTFSAESPVDPFFSVHMLGGISSVSGDFRLDCSEDCRVRVDFRLWECPSADEEERRYSFDDECRYISMVGFLCSCVVGR